MEVMFLNACENGNEDCARSCFDEIHYTVMFRGMKIACDNGNLNVLTYLMAAYGHARSMPKLMIDLIMSARKHRHHDIMDYLIPPGIKAGLSKTEREELIDDMMATYRFDIEEVCLRGNVNLLKLFVYIHYNGVIDTHHYLIEDGVFSEEMLENGLAVSTTVGSVECINYMVRLGARDFNSALVFATKSDNVPVIELLISHGADDLEQLRKSNNFRLFTIFVKSLLDDGDDNVFLRHGWTRKVVNKCPVYRLITARKIGEPPILPFEILRLLMSYLRPTLAPVGANKGANKGAPVGDSN